MKLFISYGDAADQVTALRLQALAAVHGITAYVPPAYTRPGGPERLEPEVAQKLAEADVILGVARAGLSEACRLELNTGLALAKHVVVMSHPTFAAQLQPVFGSRLLLIDPANPAEAEVGVMQQLRAVDAEQNAKNALFALGALALGLLILAPADRS